MATPQLRYSALKSIAAAHINAQDFRTTMFVSGSPGCGKSALGSELATMFPFDNVVELNLSLLDTPDVAGLALLNNDSDVLSFKKSPLLAPLQSGFNLLIMDEYADATPSMQNLGRRLLWTGEVNGLRTSRTTFKICMSNRTTDKSGAGRVSGKVKNAVSQFTMVSNLDDWTDWALGANLDPVLIQFLRFKPDLLDKYDPDADCSPTPRQWDLVNSVPTALPNDLFFADVASKVGEGPAAEYTAFRKIFASLISPEEVVMNPTGVRIPSDLSAQFAIVGSLSNFTNTGNVERVATFMSRMPTDFEVMYWMDTIKRAPVVKTSKAFINWATRNGNVVLS